VKGALQHLRRAWTRTGLDHPGPFVGVSQKSIFNRPCQFLTINAHKWLQNRTNGSKTAPGIPPHRAFCGEVCRRLGTSEVAFRGAAPANGVGVHSALEYFRFTLTETPNKGALSIHSTDFYQGFVIPTCSRTLQGFLAQTKEPPPLRTTTGPLVQSYCRVLRGGCFL
jgi:hypothetical protein